MLQHQPTVASDGASILILNAFYNEQIHIKFTVGFIYIFNHMLTFLCFFIFIWNLQWKVLCCFKTGWNYDAVFVASFWTTTNQSANANLFCLMNTFCNVQYVIKIFNANDFWFLQSQSTFYGHFWAWSVAEKRKELEGAQKDWLSR